MGRPSKAATALVQLREALPPQAASMADGMDSAAIAALTARFQELRLHAFRSAVDTAVELGAILAEGKKLLRGHYIAWLEERLGVDRSTAANYMALGVLARESPSVVERFKELGLAKLYKISRLPPKDRTAVLRTPDLRSLTDGEFHVLTARYLKPRRSVTGNMRGHGLLMKVEAATAMLRHAEAPRMTDGTKRSALKRALLDLSRAARDLSGRIRD